MIRAVVFDFDGLMVDTESSAYDSWEEIYQLFGCSLPLDVWAQVLGGSGHEFDPCAYLATLTDQPFDVAALRARRSQRKLELVANQPLLPGIADAIRIAQERGIAIAVASSSPQPWVMPHLERLAVLEQFAVIVTGDQVARVKPDPAIYQLAAQRLGVVPIESLALEDSRNGLHSAKAAGMRCVVVPNKFTAKLDLSLADLRLASLADLPFEQLLERW